MGAYQAEAIAPTSTRPAAVDRSGCLAQLIKGDLYQLQRPRGRPEVLTDWMDASVIDENDPALTDPELDPFNPDNPATIRTRSSKNIAPASARNQRITDWAKAELARLNAARNRPHLSDVPLLGRHPLRRSGDRPVGPGPTGAIAATRQSPTAPPASARPIRSRPGSTCGASKLRPCGDSRTIAKHDTPALVVQGLADTPASSPTMRARSSTSSAPRTRARTDPRRALFRGFDRRTAKCRRSGRRLDPGEAVVETATADIIAGLRAAGLAGGGEVVLDH